LAQTQRETGLPDIEMPDTSRTLIIVRHARTIWNEQGRFQGHLDSPVTEYGRLQIAAAAERLSHRQIDAVYTSDLGRSLLTADRVARAVHAPVIVDARLRERSFGIFEGLTHEYAKQRYPVLVEQVRTSTDPEFAVPRGENKLQLHTRVMPAMANALVHPGSGDVVIIGHGSLIRVFLNYVTGQALPSRENHIPRNCSISIVDFDCGTWNARIIGDDSHLPVLA